MSLLFKLALASVVLRLTPASASRQPPPHIVFITADDLGYGDLGSANGGKTFTPAIDALRAGGAILTDYHTFKICSPSRASVLGGRYPFNMGFYDMDTDDNHATTNFTLFPELLRRGGYATHALGKYDVGYMVKAATACTRANTYSPPQTHPPTYPSS